MVDKIQRMYLLTCQSIKTEFISQACCMSGEHPTSRCPRGNLIMNNTMTILNKFKDMYWQLRLN